MIERIILSLIDHLPGILSAVAGVVTAAGILVTGILTWQNGKKVDTVAVQSVANGQKSDDIHTLVNGDRAKLQAQLAEALQRVEQLETATKEPR